MSKKTTSRTQEQLAAENKDLRARLEESEEILRAIRGGEVDALIVSGVGGEQILTFKQVEEALRSSEEKYRSLVEEVNDGFYVSDEAGIFTFANPALAGIYGVETPQALVGRQFLDFVVPEMLAELGETHRRMMQAGRSPAVINSQIMRPDGTRAYIEVKSASILKGDQIIGSRGVVRDVTERRLAEEALRESEAKFRNYIEYAPDGIFIVDDTGRYIDANPSACRILGFSKEDIMKMSIQDLVAEESLEDGLAHFSKINEMNAARADLWHKHKDGSKRCLTISAVKLTKTRILGFCVDITERKKAEDELQSARTFLDRIINAIADPVFVKDDQRRFVLVNDALCATVGRPREGLLGEDGDDMFPKDQVAVFRKMDAGVLETGRENVNEESLSNLASGEVRTIVTRKTRYIDPSGRRYLVGVIRDITERKQAEIALRESEAEYRNLFENSVLGISQALPNGRLLRTNNAYAQMYGYANPKAMLAEVVDAGQLYADPEDRKEVLRILAERGVMEPREMAVVRRDGTRITVLVGAREIRDSEGILRCYQAEHIDITERKQAEEELRQSEARFRILFEQAGDIILQLEITPEGIPVIREANSATLRVLGYDRDELIGRPVSFIEAAPESDKVIGARRQNILSGTGTVFEVKHRCKDGTIRVFESSVAEMKFGSKHYAISVERDITERTRSVDRIQRQLEHLSAMSTIDRVIAANFDLMLNLSEILTHVTTELRIDAADILILIPNLQMLEFGAEHGFRARAVRKGQIRLGESYAGRAALERHLVHISNLPEEPEKGSLGAGWKGEEFISYFGVPLISKGQVKGVLEVFHRAALEPDAEWFDFLNALAGQTAIAIENSTLFESLQHSNVELTLAYDATIEGWSHALDLRDKETEGHTQRVTEMTVKLARVFGLSDTELAQARWGALLHDIGKMGVPDGILLKPGPLTDEEWVAMKKHPAFAYEMLAPIGYLRMALDIPYCHHEKWDGSGYPRGLKGTQIPLIARIFAVVDVWDALRSDRPYRAAWKEEKVREHIRTLSGTDFDPQVVDFFLQNWDSFDASSIPG